MSKDLHGSLRGFAHLDASGTSRYFFDASNGADDNGYQLVNLRLGAAQGRWRLEGWLRNAFDESYVAMAFPSPLAPSGYLGESGAPRTLGLSLACEL